MYFLDDFYLLIVAAPKSCASVNCGESHSQHPDSQLTHTNASSGNCVSTANRFPIDFGRIAHRRPSSLGWALEIRELPARTSPLIVTPELALSVGNPWAFAETPF
jgi:hypothetical protein